MFNSPLPVFVCLPATSLCTPVSHLFVSACVLSIGGLCVSFILRGFIFFIGPHMPPLFMICSPWLYDWASVYVILSLVLFVTCSLDFWISAVLLNLTFCCSTYLPVWVLFWSTDTVQRVNCFYLLTQIQHDITSYKPNFFLSSCGRVSFELLATHWLWLPEVLLCWIVSVRLEKTGRNTEETNAECGSIDVHI